MASKTTIPLSGRCCREREGEDHRELTGGQGEQQGIHLRSVSAVPIPSFWETAVIAAHCDG